MPPTPQALALLATLTLLPTAFAADREALPRYQFKPGQELAFHSATSFKYGEDKTAGEHGSQSDWTVWVLHANADGSFRLVLRENNAFAQTVDGKKMEQPARISLVYADVFPDGRVLMNKTIQFSGHPGALFPELPPDADKAKTGWASTRGDDKVSAKPLQSGKEFTFETVKESPYDKIYLMTNKTKQTFDPAKGFVVKAESENTQGYGFKGAGTGTTELLSVKMLEPAALKTLADASDKYFAALAAYEADTEAAQKAAPDEAKALLAKAVAGLKAAAPGVAEPQLKADLADKLKEHETMEKYYLDSAERRSKVLGKPADDFETTDIDGKKVRLSDMRGQVVVLDFWYRGCGWCIRAMPQINQIADDFTGKPVAVFGVNTDRNEEDAKFVIEKMGLKYRTLHGEGMPAKFGVQGFPTLIVIDQRGRVHDIHVGYTPTLREDLGKQIRDLLTSK